MIVYFDESYDHDHDYLLYGALFVPKSSTLHERIARVREQIRLFTREHKVGLGFQGVNSLATVARPTGGRREGFKGLKSWKRLE